MRTIMITGVCGAGKTTITEAVGKALNFSYGDYADMMLEVMGETDKDKIQYLSWEKRRKVYDEVEKLIVDRFNPLKSGNLVYLLENHLTIIQNGKVVYFPVEDYRKYNIIGIIVIESLPETILGRRLKDEKRKRLSGTINLIKKQQADNKRKARRISEYLNIPLYRVNNKEGKLPLDEVIAIVQKLINR